MVVSLPQVLDEQGDLDGALEHYRRAVSVYEALGVENDNDMADTLSNIGGVSCLQTW